MSPEQQSADDAVLRVLIIDDHRLVNEALSRYLEGRGTFKVQSATNLAAGIDLIATQGPFDVVCLDMVMPGMAGLTSVEEVIRAADPGHVVIFSGNIKEELVTKCLAIGAKGFIPKSFPLRSLANAIDLIGGGERFVPANLILNGGQSAEAEHNGITSLEIKVIGLIADGNTNKEIAWELGVSEATIKMHVRTISRKLGANNRTHAVVKAQEADLI